MRSQAVTEREFDARRATEREAAAQVASLEAASKQAQLNLEWTQVHAPITGRISDKRVDAGNLIAGGQTGATLLTVIVSIDPIHFVFDGSEADFLRYVRLRVLAQSGPSTRRGEPGVGPACGRERLQAQGRMDFVDNVVNPRTGTIRGRAVFENKDGVLIPGYFGRLRLFGGEHSALLVPDSSVAFDQSRKILFVVAEDGTVGVKVVELGPMVDGLRVISSGLARRTGSSSMGCSGPVRTESQARGRQDRGHVTKKRGSVSAGSARRIPSAVGRLACGSHISLSIGRFLQG